MTYHNQILVKQPKISQEELREGIILLWCDICRKTTKHQTLTKDMKPITKDTPHARIVSGLSTPKKYRKCLECQNLTLF